MNEILVDDQKGSGLKLQVSRLIKAKRQRVYEAWTKPEAMQQWFGPAEMSAANISIDVRVGGHYRIEMAKDCDGDPAAGATSPRAIATGVYQQIVPNELLSFTWQGDWVPGEDTLVTVEFKDAAGGTEVILTHERFLTTESRDGHEKGWSGSLAKLAKACEE